MHTQRTRPRLRLSALVAIVAALLLAACGNSSDKKPAAASSGAASGGSASSAAADTSQHVTITGVPGVSDTEIKYSSLGTNSNNPLGTCVLDCFDDGIKAYFDFRNSTSNGIYGRKLVLSKTVDDELSNNQPKALEIISANDTFGTFSATQISTGWGDLAAAGVPTYGWSIAPAQATGHPEIFGNAPVICIDCTSRGVAYEAKVAGAKKMATLGYGVSENSKQCADFSAQSIAKYSANIGGTTVVYTKDNLDFGLPNGIGPEVTAMKQAGVDFILACIDLNGMKTLAQELQRQGMRESVKLLHPNTYDQKFVSDAGTLFEGDLVAVGFRPFEADAGNSSLKDFHAAMAKAGKQETELAMDGWINADLAYQGLVGAGPNFDRAKAIAATNQLTAFTAGGLIAPVDWTRQHVAPTEADLATHGSKFDCVALVTIKSGKFQMVGDPTKPWSCFPGGTRDWTDPVSMNFS